MGSSLSPYVMGNCHDQRKIIFRIFSKNFQFSEFYPGRFWTPLCFLNIPTTIKKFFRRFWSEISRFHNFDACFFISIGRLILGDLFLGLSGRVLIVCADLLQIAGILHKCRIYCCAGLVSWSSAMLRRMESGRTSPGVFLADLSVHVCRISERTN